MRMSLNVVHKTQTLFNNFHCTRSFNLILRGLTELVIYLRQNKYEVSLVIYLLKAVLFIFKFAPCKGKQF